MFHRYGKKLKDSPSKPLKNLTAITAAPLLLAEEKRASLLQLIRDSYDDKPDRFDSFCLTLIHNFINHCQCLPEASSAFYAQSGGVLDYALNRTEIALNLFKQFLAQDDNDELTESQRLWQYALFSAAILKGIGKLQVDYRVQIYDNNHEFIKTWNPALESLSANGSFYHYEFLQEEDEGFRHRLNLILAKNLLPSKGFAWIASNPKVFAVWLALLNEDVYAAGTLGAILIRSDAIAIQRYFELALKYWKARAGRQGRMNTFTGGKAASIAEIEQHSGMEFNQWLIKSIESGRIMINKAPLLMVPGGMIMCDEIYQLFVREHPEYKNWQAVQKGFLSLKKLHRLGPDGGIYSRFEQANNQQMVTGVVYSNYAVGLPAQVKVYDFRTGKVNNQSTIDLIYQSLFSGNYFSQKPGQKTIENLPLLQSDGQWSAQTALQRKHQPGAASRA